jgi:hypothetical protein
MLFSQSLCIVPRIQPKKQITQVTCDTTPLKSIRNIFTGSVPGNTTTRPVSRRAGFCGQGKDDVHRRRLLFSSNNCIHLRIGTWWTCSTYLSTLWCHQLSISWEIIEKFVFEDWCSMIGLFLFINSVKYIQN